jgi:hypothetical protein
MDFVAALEATPPATTKIHTARYIDLSWKAMSCYKSQIQLSPRVRLFRKLLGRMLQGTTSLSRVYPAWQPDERIERDLFAGVTIDEPEQNPVSRP